MRFADLVTQVQNYCQRTSADNTTIKAAINWAQDEIVSAAKWFFMLTTSTFFTKTPYSTGTVTVTNGSRTLTGASTVWDASYVGAKFRLSDASPVYLVTGFTSATALTLDRPYDGTTAAAQTYSIFWDEYPLPADLDLSKLFRQMTNKISLINVDPSDFDIIFPYPVERSRPRAAVTIGKPLVALVSAVGTVSITVGASVVTGSGTSWLTLPRGLSRGSKIRLVTDQYHVKSIDSDTQLTIYETAASTQTSLANWELLLDNYLIQIWPIPDSNYEVLYRYYRRAQPLVADADISDIPEDWHWLLALGAIRRMYVFTGEVLRYQNAQTEYLRGLDTMKKVLGIMSEDQSYRLKAVDYRRVTPSAVRFPDMYPPYLVG